MSAKVLVDDTPNARAELRPQRRTCTQPGCVARALYKSDFDEDLCGDHFRALRAESCRALVPTEQDDAFLTAGDREADEAPPPSVATTSGAIMNDCLIDDCNEPGKARGLCPRHYQGGLRQTARERGIRKESLDPASIEEAELVAAAKRCIARIAGETTGTLVATTGPDTNVLPVSTLVDALATMPKDCDDPYAVDDSPGVATTEPDVAVRTVRIRQVDGTWHAAPYNDLRAGMVFELFEPDGTPANGGGWWLALSDVANDAVGTIQCAPVPEMSPGWKPDTALVLTADELERRHAALVNAKILRGSQMEILGLPSFAQEPVQAAAMAVLDAQLAYWEGIAFLGDPS